ncbi:site-specific DNA-methyltransferase [Methanobrevibacter curvatus]|nr:site-specific DNA-methyltransferase [Methanobrevibacter curvatus]
MKLSTNPETSGRYHTNYLNMIYPRLKLARNLLTDDGAIFISISDGEVENIKKICNEIFGDYNFVGNIIWNSTKSVTNTALISVSHTYNLIYFKNMDYFVKNRGEFRLPDDGEGFSNLDNDSRGLWKADPFQVGGWRPNQQYGITNPNTGKTYYPNANCSWKNDFDRFQELLKDNRIVFGKDGESAPQRKRFIWEAKERGKVSKTWWDDVETTTNGTQLLKKIFGGKSLFDNPKPIELIQKMLYLGTSENSIVLDFFSGSATTAHAVMKLNSENNENRKFIIVQIPEPTDEKSEAYKAGYKNIAEIGKERIRRAGDKILSESENKELDIGFKVFKLDSSNLNKWNPDYNNLEQTLIDSSENLVPGRTELDLIYEIMLKYGIDLTLAIEEYVIDNKKIYSIGFGSLLICLDDNITKEIATEIIKLKNELAPETIRVVFKDNGFASDSDKTNIKETLKSNDIDEFITI